MRLSYQITLLVASIMLLMLLATVYISVHGSREYLLQQMKLHSQEAGTSLANSISPILASGERPLAESMVDAVFSRGAYQKIQIRGLDGKVMIERQTAVRVSGVPGWFIRLAAIQSPTVMSPVVSGVTKIASVAVTLQPGHAYQALWKIQRTNITWIIALAVIGIILLGVMVSLALRPLTQVKQQAQAIAQQNYVLQKKFPFAAELRQLVLAMNDMAEKLESLMSTQIDHVIDLTNKVNTDAGTGLLNRQGFDERFRLALLQDPHLQGQLLIIRVSGLERLNQFFSFKRGNEELKKILDKLKTVAANEWEIARLAGADLVVLVPDAQDETLAQRCEQLVTALNNVSEDLQCFLGGVNIQVGQNKEMLLKQADRALQQAIESERCWATH